MAHMELLKKPLRTITAGLAWLLPDTCLLCKAALTKEVSDHLCSFCRLALPLNINPCKHCAVPLPSAPGNSQAVSCGSCLSKPLADVAVAPLIHQGAAAYLVHQLKFQGQARAGRALSQLMIAAITNVYQGSVNSANGPDVIVPAPLSWPAQVRRGFNQAHYLAQPLAKALQVAIEPRVITRKSGPPQRKLSAAERRRLPANTYRVKRRYQGSSVFQHCHVAVIDDVLTTGSTARQIIQLIRRQGASRVDLWCATRASLAQA